MIVAMQGFLHLRGHFQPSVCWILEAASRGFLAVDISSSLSNAVLLNSLTVEGVVAALEACGTGSLLVSPSILQRASTVCSSYSSINCNCDS